MIDKKLYQKFKKFELSELFEHLKQFELFKKYIQFMQFYASKLYMVILNVTRLNVVILYAI